ncbi:hypothetical protein Bca52824_093889 [Brassica carinata]|uniref:Peptidase S33 tripeptidyl aminopeptidase-like C-terminal domain-containing protein n=1 Tax=Brassica carinata TaxID=52824 RepID=A0A8X7TLA7_BRACI|nr:hypothetical protein Bca52824_093889 [Brassica carinata]
MLYKASLCLEAWDEALSEIILSPQATSAVLNSVGDIPALVVAGAEDALVPLKSSQVLASKLTNSASFTSPHQTFHNFMYLCPCAYRDL